MYVELYDEILQNSFKKCGKERNSKRNKNVIYCQKVIITDYTAQANKKGLILYNKFVKNDLTPLLK